MDIPVSPIAKDMETALLLPLRNMVLLPEITLPVIAGRPRSVAVAEATMQMSPKQVVIATVRPDAAERLEADEHAEIESLDELYPIATLAIVQRLLRLPIGPVQLIVEGQERVYLRELLQDSPTYKVQFQRLPKLTTEAALAAGTDSQSLEALTRTIQSLWREAAALNPNFPEEVLTVLLNSDNPTQLAYQTAILLQQDVPNVQKVLEEDDLPSLLHLMVNELQQEVEIYRLRMEIMGETKKELDQQQREFILRQQLKKIQEELGETDPEKQELEELRTLIE
ncbi:MAG: LON peptidase substrate-binding domain-containing protein, partial [Coleofasciculus sp. C2-GNP5-27]